jgi:hypothetical protein
MVAAQSLEGLGGSSCAPNEPRGVAIGATLRPTCDAVRDGHGWRLR